LSALSTLHIGLSTSREAVQRADTTSVRDAIFELQRPACARRGEGVEEIQRVEGEWKRGRKSERRGEGRRAEGRRGEERSGEWRKVEGSGGKWRGGKGPTCVVQIGGCTARRGWQQTLYNSFTAHVGANSPPCRV
jgi:hypothetical protein